MRRISLRFVWVFFATCLVLISFGCGSSGSTPAKPTPLITWSTPSAITYGTALSATQLNATASYNGSPVAGTFSYSPASGTLLTAGNQTLTTTFTPTDTTSYGTATASVTLVVNQVTPTVSWATPAAITYGTALSATQLNATASVPGSFVYTPAAGSFPPAGTQTLSVKFTPTDATDYAAVTATTTLAVSKSTTLLSWANPASITYGTALSATQLNATATNQNGGGAVAGTYTYTPAAGTVLGAGNQTLSVTFTPTDTADLLPPAGPVTVSLVVNKATPLLTWATPAPITAGTALSATQLNATASFGGSPLAGSFAYTPASGTVLPAGTQTLNTTFTPTDTTDFTTATASVQLGVKQNPVISWATPSAITYGTALSATQLNATASVPGTFVYTPTAGTVLTAGTQILSVTFTPTDTTSYFPATATVSLIVNKATPTISWPAPGAITYGTALSATQLNATANTPGSFVYSPSAGAVLTVGAQTLSVTFTPTDTTDYKTANATTTLLVNQATPTITWATPAAVTVGATLSASQLNATANVPGSFVYTPPAGTALLTAGNTTLSTTFTPTDTVDYANATATVTISVTKVTPTIVWPTPAAVNVGAVLGATQLNATASINGAAIPGTFVYTPAAGLTINTAGTLVLNTVFTPADTASYGSASASVNLTVNKGIPIITWPSPIAITYGTALSGTQLNAAANVGGTFVYTPAAGTVPGAGVQTLSVAFTPMDPANYTGATGSTTLTVNKATPIITWPTPAPIAVGTALSATQLNATANTPGTFVYTPPAGTVQSVTGNVTLSTTFTPTDTTDYVGTSATVTLVVSASGTPSYTWKNVQIVGGGYVTGFVFHPRQQNLIYARTDVGGSYRWNPTTSTWTPLTDLFDRTNWWLQGTEAIGIDPTDPMRLYLAVGEYANENWDGNGAILVSTDQGNTFTQVNLPFKVGSNDTGRGAGERIVVDPNSPNIVYYGTRLVGLYVSKDHGSTWNQMSSFPVTGSTNSGVGVITATFIQSSGSAGSATPTVYVAVSATGSGGQPSSVYVTTNGGTTWSAVPGQPTGQVPTHMVLGPDGALYFTFSDKQGPDSISTGQIWKYVLPSGGNPNGTWSNITPSRPGYYQGGFGAIAVDPANANNLVATTIDQYYPGDDIYCSNNGGTTWNSANAVGANRDVSLSPWVTFGAAKAGAGNWASYAVIDPYNSGHFLYGTGQTIWQTNDITDCENGNATNWTIGAQGLEETVVGALSAPPTGQTLIYSGMGDIQGFHHTSLTASPADGQESPVIANASIDFAQSNTQYAVRVGYSSPYGAYTTNAGTSWTKFNSTGGTGQGAGQVAVAADGSTIVWAPKDVAPMWSADNGTTWTTSTGAPTNSGVVADRINPKKFYIFNSGTLYMSTDSGHSFSSVQSGLPGSGSLIAAYDAEGDLWLAAQGSGLYHSNNGTATPGLTQISSVQNAYLVGVGAAKSGSSYLTLFIDGQVGGTYGYWRSTDNGNSWIQINDSTHLFGYLSAMTGDPRTFGRVFLATPGRGIVYADSPN